MKINNSNDNCVIDNKVSDNKNNNDNIDNDNPNHDISSNCYDNDYCFVNCDELPRQIMYYYYFYLLVIIIDIFNDVIGITDRKIFLKIRKIMEKMNR